MQISEKESHHHHHDDTCNHDHHEHGPGCACEADLLENIDEDVEQSKKPLAIFAIGIAVLAIGHVIELLSLAPMIVSQLIFLVGAVYVGHDIMKHGIIELTHKKVKIELLITIATIGAFLLGSGGEGALLMVLFYLGEYLEHYSLNKSKSSLVKLVKMTPDTALVNRRYCNCKTWR